MMNGRIKIDSVVKCINCGHKELHHMPLYAAKTYYECPKCQAVHRPLENKCCIYCSYGSTLCPPTQRRLKASSYIPEARTPWL
jgi:hypothetical protein